MERHSSKWGRVVAAIGRLFPGRKAKVRAIIISLIDVDWYLYNYPEVLKSGLGACEHYLRFGVKTGKLPNAYFDATWYLDMNPDVRASGVDPLVHYAEYGWREGRNPGPRFDAARYLQENPDIWTDGLNPLGHFLKHVRYENRSVYPVELQTAPRSIIQCNSDEIDTALMKFVELMTPLCADTGPIAAIFALPVLGRGGSEKVAFCFADVFLDAHPNCSVLVLVTDLDRVDETIQYRHGLNVFRLLDFGPGFERGAKEALLLRILQAVRPQIFHIINSDVAWTLLLDQGRRLQRLTRVFGSIFCVQRDYDTKRLHGFAANYFCAAIHSCEAVLTDNQAFARDVAQIFPDHMDRAAAIIPVYSPTTWPQEETQSVPALPTDMRSPSAHPSILWAGRLDRQKRVELLFEIAARLPHVRFYVMGASVTDGDVELRDIANVVMCGGFTSSAELCKDRWYDAYMHTTHEEGLPNILLEIGCLGIPIIAPAIGGIPELITCRTGYLLPTDASALDYEAAILEIISDAGSAGRRAAHLQALIRERHSWSKFREAVQAIPAYLQSMA